MFTGMSLQLSWVGSDQFERVARVRLRCYGSTADEMPKFVEWTRGDKRVASGDWLLAERDGQDVGTAASLSMTMWVRGAPLPCQGVAWVGTVRTARRAVAPGSPAGAGDGVASRIMRQVIQKGREREQVVSALMPFRASFYEHFGYGVIERRARWTVPMSILPAGGCDSFRYFEPSDAQAVAACRQRQVESGQCDIETSAGGWENRHDNADEGFAMVDRPSRDGPAHSWMLLCEERVRDRRHLRVDTSCYDSPEALRRVLRFLACQKDQYFGAIITLPVDLPLNHILRESQVPHRPVEHPTAEASLTTRMQVRVLDHVRFFERLNLPLSAGHVRGAATIAVRESEGHIARFRLEISDGRTRASLSDSSPDVECSDVTWATLACGAVRASDAVHWGLIHVNRPDALTVLDALSIGPAPFCDEYF
jgi:predicted acetyltransferase